MKPGIDEPQAYLSKLAPIYTELFRVAHTIVGNGELAEYVLKKATYEAWQRRSEWQERMSFSEGLGQTVRMVALVELQNIKHIGSFELDWQLPPIDPQDVSADQRQILSKLSREGPELTRALMLYYGCGLRISQIAQVLGVRAAAARDMLYMFRTRLERSRQRMGDKHHMEDNLERLLLAMLSLVAEDVPDSGALFRAFERDVAFAPKPRLSKGRVMGIILGALGAILCAVVFWVFAILMEPDMPVVEPEAARIEELSQISTRIA